MDDLLVQPGAAQLPLSFRTKTFGSWTSQAVRLHRMTSQRGLQSPVDRDTWAYLPSNKVYTVPEVSPQIL